MAFTGDSLTGLVVDSYSRLLSIGLSILIIIILLTIAIYIYYGFAFMAIGKRTKLKSPELAWIPFIGPKIIAFKASKMPSWPWWLLFTFPIFFIMPVTILILFPAMILFFVYAVIWDWKMFEAVNKPGWWALMIFIPFGVIVYWVLIGIAAWGNPK